MEYCDVIRNIEKTFAIRWTTTNEKTKLSGQALSIRFPRPIPNIAKFCDHVFSSALPFRLWGVPIELKSDFYRVSGVDLHAGCRLDFEITPEFMRLYLPANSCGNTIVRLYTNLKHHYDSQITIVGEDGKPIL